VDAAAKLIRLYGTIITLRGPRYRAFPSSNAS
jgi:hypothetical protein